VSLAVVSGSSFPSPPDWETLVILLATFNYPHPHHHRHTRQPHFTIAVSPFRAGHGITVLTTLIDSWPSSADTQAIALDNPSADPRPPCRTNTTTTTMHSSFPSSS
jgi:hypothetical protein